MSKKTREKWKEQASENQNKAREMIHDIGMNYTRSPEQIAEILAFGTRFYKYSLNNIKLIYAQNRGALYVQSFAAWKEMDVSVQKGQKGMKIFVPVLVTTLLLEAGSRVSLQNASKEQKELYKQGKIEARKDLRFKIGNVFDISQTSFPSERYPEIYSMGYASVKHSVIVEGLRDYCREIGISVSEQDLTSIALRGYYQSSANRIVLNELLDDTEKLSTLTHEIGHAIEGHGKRNISSAQEEFEADCISVMIQSKFEMELTDTRKAHLAEHYQRFANELKQKNTELTEEELIKNVDDALTASLQIFSDHMERIEECVKNYLEKAVPDAAIENTNMKVHKQHRGR